MPRIFVDFHKLDSVENDIFDVWRRVGEEKRNFKNTIDKLDWEVKSQERILRRSQQVADKLDKIAQSLDSYSKFILHSYEEYDKLEHYEQKLDFGLDGIQDKPTEQRRNNIFDEQNGYGGDQGDMAHNRNGKAFLWWVKGEDEDIYDFVRSQEGYEKYTKRQIHDLLEQINNEGCGYVALVNTLFWEFDGTEVEFEELFGFPMRDEDGNYNFNRMLIDIYCKTDDKYFLNENGSKQALCAMILEQYKTNPTKFEIEYGIEYPNIDSVSEKVQKAIIDKYKTDIVVVKDNGLNRYTEESRLLAYLKDKNIDAEVNYTYFNIMSNEDIKTSLANGTIVQVNLSGGTALCDESGKVRQYLGGDHGVLLTGVTDDGRYVISSYGEKYYIDPKQTYTDSQTGEIKNFIMEYNTIDVVYK